jgi:hypothetical protein
MPTQAIRLGDWPSTTKTGDLVTSLLKDTPPSTQTCDHGLQYIEQYAKGSAVKIRNPLGRVVALADKKVKAGDKLLFFADFSDDTALDTTIRGPPVAGLIIRLTKCGIRILVGQVVVDHGIIRPVKRWNSQGELSEHGLNEWWILMSPLDLVLFAAQDMISEVSSSRDGPVIKRTYCPQQTAKRLTTSVTSDLNSSYVFRKRLWDFELPRGFLTILDRSVINLP